MASSTDNRRDPYWIARRNFQAEVTELAAFYFGRVPRRWQRYVEDLLAADVDESVAGPKVFVHGAVQVRAALWGFALATLVFAVGLVLALEVL